MIFHLLQFNIAWEDKESNINFLTRQLENLSPKNSIVLLPETFTTGFTMNANSLAEKSDGYTSKWMLTMAKKFNCLIAGSVLVKHDKEYFNRFLWAFPDGSIKYYNKRHLFRMGGENNTFQAGQERVIIEWNGVRILPLVCYDLRFPVWSRNQNDYDVIVYSSNWPASRINAWQTLLKARAIENQAYVLGVNRVGIDGENIIYGGTSMAVDFKGELLKIASQIEEKILTVDVDLTKQQEFKNSFPVWKDADKFNIQ